MGDGLQSGRLIELVVNPRELTLSLVVQINNPLANLFHLSEATFLRPASPGAQEYALVFDYEMVCRPSPIV